MQHGPQRGGVVTNNSPEPRDATEFADGIGKDLRVRIINARHRKWLPRHNDFIARGNDRHPGLPPDGHFAFTESCQHAGFTTGEHGPHAQTVSPVAISVPANATPKPGVTAR